jgi:DNA-directed RNA polymerase subunit M/transcription elongation factor TFIIS
VINSLQRPTVPEQLVTVGSYSTPYEASLVQAKLDSFGIDASVADAEIIRMNWTLSNALGGVKVQVPETQAEEALRILAAAPGDESAEAQDETEVVTCPVCGSRNMRFFQDKRGSMLTWLLVGFPIIPSRSKWECADCGNKWEG